MDQRDAEDVSAASSGTRLRRMAPLLAAILLGIHFCIMYFSAQGKSATSDEPFHLARGASAVFSDGDFRMSVAHPPLINVLSALPLLFVPDLKVPISDYSWRNPRTEQAYAKLRFTMLLLSYLNPNGPELIQLGRIPVMILSVILGLLVYLWSKSLYGARSGLFALWLYCFCPTMIAHGQLVTTDTGLALFMFIAVYLLGRHLSSPSWARLVIAGVGFGLAQLSKFTAVFLLPIFVIVMFMWPGDSLAGRVKKFFQLDPRERAFQGGLGGLLVIGLVCWFVIWAGYGFEIHPFHLNPITPPEGSQISEQSLRRFFVETVSEMHLPPPTYFYGLGQTMLDTMEHGHELYFLGRTSERGWWYYYPVLFVMKVPVALLIFLVMAAGTWKRQPRLSRPLGLLIAAPVLVMVLFFGVLNEKNIGIRHLLGIFPFIHLFLSRLPLVIKGRWGRGCILALSLWYAGSSLAAYPDYLVYFNELVGGAEGGLRYSVVGEDWGQDMAGLAEYYHRRGLKHINYTPYGNMLPQVYGMNYTKVECGPPQPGVTAMHIVEMVRPLREKPPDCYEWYKTHKPNLKIGHTVWIYEVPEAGEQ